MDTDISLHLIQFTDIEDFRRLHPLHPVPAVWKFFLQRDFPFQSRNLFNPKIDYTFPNPSLAASLRETYFSIRKKDKLIWEIILDKVNDYYHVTSTAILHLRQLFSLLPASVKLYDAMMEELMDEITETPRGEALDYRGDIFMKQVKEIEESIHFPRQLRDNAKHLVQFWSNSRTFLPVKVIMELSNVGPHVIVWHLVKLNIANLADSDSAYYQYWEEMVQYL